jgi:uncharacterized membrane protein YbhN (UPF0104 family)
MGTVLKVTKSKRTRRIANTLVAVTAIVVSIVSTHHFLRHGWPIKHANPLLVAAAGFLFLGAYGFKALGWRRLFAKGEQPDALGLAAAGGAAAVGGIALPGRFDEAIRIAVVRRYPGTRSGIGAVCLTLFLLGLIDAAALTPMASVAAAWSGSSGVRIGFALVALAGVAAAAVVCYLPRIARLRRVQRFKLSQWVQEHCACPREASKAWLLVSASWVLRGVAVFLLLDALSVGASFPMALMFLCASAASAALPIAPAGAATQAGAGAAILVVAGVKTTEAIAFALAAQALIIVAGAIVVAAAAAWQVSLRLRPRAATSL